MHNPCMFTHAVLFKLIFQATTNLCLTEKLIEQNFSHEIFRIQNSFNLLLIFLNFCPRKITTKYFVPRSLYFNIMIFF